MVLYYFLHLKKSGNALPQSTVTRSVAEEFPADDDKTRRPVSTKGLHQVSSARAHGRADEVGPSFAQDVELASAGNRPAQSSVPTFFGTEEVCKEVLVSLDYLCLVSLQQSLARLQFLKSSMR